MYSDWEWLLAGMDRVLAPVATPLGFVLALVVTSHILLTKRDVAAAIGWIGLAWLAPVWGTALYFMFGINRVVRRARQVRERRPSRERGASRPAQDFAGHLQPLDHAVRRITNRRAEAGNAVKLFQNGDEGYPAMLEAIAAASRSVALASYIMLDDAVGARFVQVLAAARRRGVAVKVLIDGIGSGYFPGIYRHLRREGVEAALFMHSALPWRMPFLNLRSHKKLLVVDGALAFTGGLNIAAANVLADKPPWPVADTHFRFDGPVVRQLTDAFASDWAFTTGEEIDGPAWYPELEETGEAVARLIASGPDKDLEKIQFVLLEAIGCATTSVRFMTPYFLPHDEIVTALMLAALRGVDVEITVPRRSDHRFLDYAMQAHVDPLLRHGVRIWYGTPPFNHSKLLVVDRRWCLIGSANWDMRSLRLNFELDVEVYSSPLAHEIERIMEAQQDARLREHDLRARSLALRLRDAGFRMLLPYI